MSSDFLVIYEEEDGGGPDADDSDDEIVLDIRTLRQAFRHHLDVETGVLVKLHNSSSAGGFLGLILTIIGAIVAIAAVAVFASTYPQDWFKGAELAGYGLRRGTATMATVGGLLMIAGTILTAFGRRVTAHAFIDDAHIVEKSPHARPEMR
jgi:hypothetical protein